MAAEMGAPDGVTFHPWPDDRDMPSHSLPALEAGKCAERQGAEAFARYHEALLRAYFELNRDISQRDVLIQVADSAGLDVAGFQRDLDEGTQRAAVLADFIEAQTRGITAVPTVLLADAAGAVRVVGEVPLAQYRRVVDWLLAT